MTKFHNIFKSYEEHIIDAISEAVYAKEQVTKKEVIALHREECDFTVDPMVILDNEVGKWPDLASITIECPHCGWRKIYNEDYENYSLAFTKLSEIKSTTKAEKNGK